MRDRITIRRTGPNRWTVQVPTIGFGAGETLHRPTHRDGMAADRPHLPDAHVVSARTGRTGVTMTARIPVFIRVGSGTEHLVGSIPGLRAESNANGVVVHASEGMLGVAVLLEAVATEIRRKAGQPRSEHTTLLIAASEHDAKSWQRRYPGRWTDACPVGSVTAMSLEGMRVTFADVTPAALASEHLDQVVDVVERSIAFSVPRGARVGVGYLEPE